MTLYTSETVDGAVKQALQQLQLDRSQVEVAVLTKPRKGFFGIGARKARVDIKPAVTVNSKQPKKRQKNQSLKQRMSQLLNQNQRQ